MKVNRGDIYMADLTPSVGSEQTGVRPVLVIQNNVGNRYAPTIIVAAITSQIKKELLPTHVELTELSKPSIVLLEQMRTLDKRRLREKVISLSNERMKEIDKAILISLGCVKEIKGEKMTDKEQIEELEKENKELQQCIDWYKMWHKQFQKQIEDLTNELETYRPTKLKGEGQCSCYGCEQRDGFNRHWTSWCYKYKGHVYCEDCLKEVYVYENHKDKINRGEL